MLDSPEHHADAVGISDSRAQSRLQVHSLAYIELTDDNAGLILNISETGLAVQAVQILTCDSFERMRFRLPRTEERIEAAGRLAWQIRSKKEAGIAFVDLPEETRAQISAWIDAERDRRVAPQPADSPERPPDGEAHGPLENRHEGNTSPWPEGVSEPSLTAQRSWEIPEDLKDRAAGELPPPRLAGRTDSQRPTNGASIFDLSLLDETFPPERPAEDEKVPTAIPDRPRPNEQTAQPVGRELKKRRAWWAYAAPGFVAALVLAAVVMFKSNTMIRTRVGPMPAAHSGRTDNAGPGRRNGRKNGQPLAENTAGVERAQNSPAHSLGAPVAPNNAESSTGASAAPAVIPHIASPAPVTRNNATPPGANPPTHPQAAARNFSVASGAGLGRLEPQPAAEKRGLQTSGAQNAVQVSQPTSRNPASLAANAHRAPRGANNRTLQERIPATAAISTSRSQTDLGARRRTTNQNVQQRVRSTDAGKMPTQQNGAARPPNQKIAEVRREPVVPPPALRAGANPVISSKNEQTTQRPQPLHAGALGARQTATGEPPSNPAGDATLRTSAASSAPRTPVTPSAPSPVPSGFITAKSRFYGFIIPPELQSGNSQLAGQLQIGQPVSSYPPVYPTEAAREGIQGTVKLDVTVNRDGSVKDIRAITGPVTLMSAAETAVRGWRYQQTFVGGHAVEAREYVTILFKIAGH